MEELGARPVGRRIAGPLGEDRPDKDLERVLGVVSKIGDPPVAPAVERAQPVEDRLPWERIRCGHSRPPEGGGVDPGSERSGSSSPPGSSARRSSPIR